MTKEEAVKRVLDIARAELGYHESGDNLTKYASAYNYDSRLYGFDMNGQPWCDYFVDWLFMSAFGFERGSAMTYQYAGCSGAACAASAGYYQQHGAWHATPEPGDQIFFYYGNGINHTGIVESVDRGYVTTIEGNSSDQVRRNLYRVADSSIAGYGRPSWCYADLSDSNAGEGPAEEESPDVFDSSVPISGNLLRKGDTGPAVLILQVCINYYLGEFYLDPDGEFGLLTQAAVTEFQRSMGLEADGVVGPLTWSALFGRE